MAAGETPVTIIGNLTADPELRFTPKGAAVANFTVASTPRFYDNQAGEWRDGETLFMRCNLWKQPAENMAESLTQGTRVIVTGRLKQRSFETREGEKRTVVECEVEEVGPSLKFATVKVNKIGRGGDDGENWGSQRQSRQPARSGQGRQPAPADDPWGSAPAPGTATYDDEPPF